MFVLKCIFVGVNVVIMLINVVFLLTLSSVSSGANILCVFPITSAGHAAFHQSIYKQLALKGHQVTVVAHSRHDNIPNVTQIEITSLQEIAKRNNDKTRQMFKNNNIQTIFLLAAEFFSKLVEETVKHVETIFPDTSTRFDLLLVDALHPLIHSLGCRFKAPVVGLMSTALSPPSHSGLGNQAHPLLYQEILPKLDDNITFYEKLGRVFFVLIDAIHHHWFALLEMDQTTKKYFGHECPHIDRLHKNTTLILANTNQVFNNKRPNVPALIEIGGLIHVRQKQPLPEDLQTYLDKSTQGVIYFSLGSTIKSFVISENTTNVIIEALGELPYNVLWKWDDDLIDKPKNVVIRKWLPQQDLLGHKNIKAYITHGGLQSIEEAIANCVPMIGMPIFADQFMNVLRIMKLGMGKGIDQTTMTAESLRNTVVEVAENKKYKERIKEVRKLILDQPMQGVDKAVWWIEYVLRHKHTKYRKSATADMPWCEYFLLDLIAFSTVIVLCVIIVAKKLAKIF